ncbi:MAG: hypothetical protein ACRDKI_08870 [Solirubrobacterales bacterium]
MTTDSATNRSEGTAAPPSDRRQSEFRFTRAAISATCEIEFGYRLDDGTELVEHIAIPVAEPLSAARLEELGALVDVLHWVAGVSYFKASVADRLEFDGPRPTAAQAALIQAIYSEGLGEFAYVNELDELPNPLIAGPPAEPRPQSPEAGTGSLVAIGGGKDSIVALAAAQLTSGDRALFSVGDPVPIHATAEVAGLPRLIATRKLDPRLFELNAEGAPNGHVPITAIVSLIGAITATANGFANVVMANERSASSGNVQHYGIDVNHQFSKGLRCERLLIAAIADSGTPVRYFSILRGASELLIARAFAQLTEYHHAFTSCNTVFKIDERERGTSWCGDCPKCRFVFLALAPFMTPDALVAIFGKNLLDDAARYDEFARLADVGGFKPFECVGETDEAVAAFQLLAGQPAWSDAAVVRRFAEEVLKSAPHADPAAQLAWSSDHEIPEEFEVAARELLGA